MKNKLRSTLITAALFAQASYCSANSLVQASHAMKAITPSLTSLLHHGKHAFSSMPAPQAILGASSLSLPEKKVLIFHDFHSEMDHTGQMALIDQVQKKPLEHFFNTAIYPREDRVGMYLESGVYLKKFWTSLNPQQQHGLIANSDYFKQLYAHFNVGNNPTKYKNLDLDTFETRTELDEATTDAFVISEFAAGKLVNHAAQHGKTITSMEDVDPVANALGRTKFFDTDKEYQYLKQSIMHMPAIQLLKQKGDTWFYETCARAQAAVKALTPHMPKNVHQELVTHSNNTMNTTHNLIQKIAGGADCSHLPHKILEILENDPQGFEKTDHYHKTLVKFHGLCVDNELLKKIITDKHKLTLVHTGAAHAENVLFHLDEIGSNVMTAETVTPKDMADATLLYKKLIVMLKHED